MGGWFGTHLNKLDAQLAKKNGRAVTSVHPFDTMRYIDWLAINSAKAAMLKVPIPPFARRARIVAPAVNTTTATTRATAPPVRTSPLIRSPSVYHARLIGGYVYSSINSLSPYGFVSYTATFPVVYGFSPRSNAEIACS